MKKIPKIIYLSVLAALIVGTANLNYQSFASSFTPDSLTKGSGITMIGHASGDFTCNDGKNFRIVDMFIWLSEKTVEGSYGSSGLGLKTLEGSRIGISLDEGTVGDEFEVQGKVFVDEMCGEELITITSSGNCGSVSQITIKTSTGSSGNFVGAVDCI